MSEKRSFCCCCFTSFGSSTANLTGSSLCAIATCRITHAYRDGAAPYFTVICPARRGAELQQWALMKAAITDAMLDHGATVTHHHAVGRDFRPWYARQVPVAFQRALAAAKGALDPSGVLNPGVLLSKSATLGG